MHLFRKPASLAAAALAAVVFASAPALADNPHYTHLGAPSLGGDDGLDYTLSFKEAGLGNIGSSASYELDIPNATVTYQCFNKGGHAPSGSPFQIGPVAVSGQQSFTVSKNGSVSGTMEVEDPELPAGTKCTGNGHFCVTAYSYTGATLTDPAGTVTGLPNLTADGVILCGAD